MWYCAIQNFKLESVFIFSIVLSLFLELRNNFFPLFMNEESQSRKLLERREREREQKVYRARRFYK